MMILQRRSPQRRIDHRHRGFAVDGAIASLRGWHCFGELVVKIALETTTSPEWFRAAKVSVFAKYRSVLNCLRRSVSSTPDGPT
jgi:hypothetical protein